MHFRQIPWEMQGESQGSIVAEHQAQMVLTGYPREEIGILPVSSSAAEQALMDAVVAADEGASAGMDRSIGKMYAIIKKNNSITRESMGGRIFHGGAR